MVPSDLRVPRHPPPPEAMTRGRPALPPGVARTERIRVAVTPAEMARLHEIARAEGLTLSEWVRRAILPST